MSDTNAFGQPTITPPPPPAVPSAVPADQEPALLTEQEQLASLTELLARVGEPELLPLPWRIRHRNRLRILAARLSELLDDDGKLTVDLDDVADVAGALDFFGDVDDFFESVAANPNAYATWSATLDDPEQVLLALLAKYGRAVGESSTSANGSTATASS
ncbi:hypothetical protein [Curtobacterium sp. Curtsp57]|uniref:hypothetical protein n=1 Tax=Curtobacterium sp. Curtsp57 TaxID=3243047 RepID=UPI0039B6B13A